jgi:quercetin dioxygenase-like cupin family protein
VRRTRSLATGLSFLVALLLLLTAPAALAQGASTGWRVSTFAVTHGPVTATLVPATSDGHTLGDVRAFHIPFEAGRRTAAGNVDAILTTTALDTPAVGDEVRLGLLVFTFGDGRDQLVVQGSAVYPAAGATIAADSSTTRPVTGGSGRYFGASGSARSIHLADGSWRHAFRLLLPRVGRGGGRDLVDTPTVSTPPAPTAAPGASASPAAVVRTDLGTTLPDTAPGLRLGLWRVTIPVGASLPAHWHPGYQLARIESGTLTYTILSGELTILHPDGTTSTASAGQTVDIPAGTSVVEQPEARHSAANLGEVPIEIVLASLFTNGADAAILVAPAAPAPSPIAPAAPAP